MASAGPYASLHLAPDRWPRQHPTVHFFTGRMPFLPPNQQRQSTEGNTSNNDNNDRLTVPEGTFTHSHLSESTCFLYHLSPFATIHGILFIQLTCLTVLTYNLFPGLLWSSPWSWTLNFMLHTFLHPHCIYHVTINSCFTYQYHHSLHNMITPYKALTD